MFKYWMSVLQIICTKQEDEDFIRYLFEHGLLFAFQTAVAQRQATSSGDVIQKLPRNINFYLL